MPPPSPNAPAAEAPAARLADRAADVLVLGLRLRAAGDPAGPDALRPSLLDALGRFERDARRAGADPDDVDAAKFALVAFLDEALLAADWPGREAWMARPLQLDLYDRYDAGQEFFVRLEKLRAQPEAHADAIEVYFLVLALGFKGQYGLHEQARLRYLIEDVVGELQRLGRGRGPLAPGGHRPEEDVAPRRGPVTGLRLAMAVAGALALLYVVLFVTLTRRAGAVADRIETLSAARP